MKKLILVLLFLPLFSFAQKRDSVYVQNKVFTLVYSEVLEQPKWVKYKVTCAENNVSRKGLDFYKEKTIHTSDNEDYVANDWDKGHMAPAAAFGCNAELLKQTFTYLNSALQQAWSLHTQSMLPASKCSQRYSTSSRLLMGGFTLACKPQPAS